MDNLKREQSSTTLSISVSGANPVNPAAELTVPVRELLIKLGATALGVLGYVYLRFCYLTSRFQVTRQAQRSLEAWWAGLPSVFVCWHDEFLTCLVSIQQPRIRQHKPLFVTNDSFGGQFLETFCRCLGLPRLVMPLRASRGEKLHKLGEGLEDHGALAIAADYGRPWFQAHPTSRTVAAMADGAVVAMSLSARRTWVLRFRDGKRIQLPLPFNTYTLRLSPPQQPSALAEASALTEALNALRN